MKQLCLRAARPDDFNYILAINAEGYPGVSPLTPSELAMARQFSPYFGVAEVDSQIAGYVITYRAENVYDGEEFNWFKQNFTDFLYIDQVAVAGSARRLRVGTQLYRQLEQIAQEKGFTSLVCEVNLEPPNPVSLNFHARQGFKEVGTMETQDGRRVSLQCKRLFVENYQIVSTIPEA